MLNQCSPPNLVPRHSQNCSARVRLRAHGAGACVLTSANNKTSSPRRRMQLVHLPNHGSLKISAERERALQRMICPRPHRKSVAKLEIEPTAPGSGATAPPRAQGHPGTCPHAALGQRGRGDVGLMRSPCSHVFEPSGVAGCPCSRCSAGLAHLQESMPGTQPCQNVQ